MMAAIHLSFEDRRKLSRDGKCPNCQGTKFVLKGMPTPEHPLFKSRPVYECESCGFFTDYFDGYTWYPPEKGIEKLENNKIKKY